MNSLTVAVEVVTRVDTLVAVVVEVEDGFVA